jgi:hypothetical protein
MPKRSIAGIERQLDLHTIEWDKLCNVYSQLFQIAGLVLACFYSGVASASL